MSMMKVLVDQCNHDDKNDHLSSSKWQFYGNIERLKWPIPSNSSIGFALIKDDVDYQLFLTKDNNSESISRDVGVFPHFLLALLIC